ncbi:MAG: endonuclease/exonuclease/phosphatase family protein [Acidimicrobiaceae bacterium]
MEVVVVFNETRHGHWSVRTKELFKSKHHDVWLVDETLQRFADAHGWVDLGRKHIPAPERNYSWWSYRSYWRAKDQGRRLDHMWASPQAAAQTRSHRFVEETRKWEQPSDHIPLITELDL